MCEKFYSPLSLVMGATISGYSRASIIKDMSSLPHVSAASRSDDIPEVVAPVHAIGQVGPMGDEVVTPNTLVPVADTIFAKKL